MPKTKEGRQYTYSVKPCPQCGGHKWYPLMVDPSYEGDPNTLIDDDNEGLSIALIDTTNMWMLDLYDECMNCGVVIR